MKPKKLLTKKDALLIALILVIGLSTLGIRHWTSNDDTGLIMAEIRSDCGVHLIHLDENQIFYIIPNVIFEIRDGRIAFIKSDCPDQICVRAGFIGQAGQMAACLPNGLVLSLLGAEDL